MRIVFVCFLLVAAHALCQQRDVEPLSAEKERALGRQFAGMVLREATVVEDAAIHEQVNRIAQAVAARCLTGHPIEVHVLVSDGPNGYALPGGFLFLSTGRIRIADSESELAAVLAHLIAHTRRGPHRLVGSVRPIPVIHAGGRYGHPYQRERTVPLPPSLGFRESVISADTLGARCLADAAYDPQGAVRSIERIRRDEAGDDEDQLMRSTHPPAAERIEWVQAALDTLPPQSDPVVTTHGFGELKKRVEALYPRRSATRAYDRRDGGPPRLRRGQPPSVE
jgi:predicted Zn-dependent protease